MPTLKPRVQVTLEPQTHAVIERLAELQGRTRGAVIADLLDSITPVMARTVALLEAAASAPQQVKDGLRSVVQGVHDELVAKGGASTAQMDMLLESLSGGSASGSTPVPVTRGSGTDSTPNSKAPKTHKKGSKPGVSD
jgi:hypothetical protein